ncbi:MAG: YdcF family protein [Bacteroidia bacterium]|nr:YdcF family protein [Bacteroidia bacterium]
MKTLWPTVKKVFKLLFLSLGLLFFILLVFSFTRLPYDIHFWLGTKGAKYKFTPDYIIFLGGSGMPSSSNLIRIYYVSALSEKYPLAKILITHPTDTSVLALMRAELAERGVDSMRIEIEKKGTNTRAQAIKIAEDFPQLIPQNIVIVTSPENMLRTVKVFRKAGFINVGGQSAFENEMFIDLTYNHKKIGGKIFIPDVSSNLNLRYNFWNYLKLEISCLREFVAIGYYWLNGWI